MYQRAQVHGRRLCSGLIGVCLLLLFAISHAKAGPLPPSPPPRLAPLLLNGTLFFNLIPRVDFDLFGNYSLFQPGQTANFDSLMAFRALGTPAPFLGARLTQPPLDLGVPLPLSPTSWRSLVAPVTIRFRPRLTRLVGCLLI